jgi:hypothetical protein
MQMKNLYAREEITKAFDGLPSAHRYKIRRDSYQEPAEVGYKM